MKKWWIVILIIIVVLAITLIISFLNASKNLEELKNIKIDQLDLSNVEDGTYTGSYDCFPVMAEVNVTVSNHQITEINIVKHQHGKGGKAEAITDDVIAKQSLDVDTIAGATHSSKVILLAIDNALSK